MQELAKPSFFGGAGTPGFDGQERERSLEVVLLLVYASLSGLEEVTASSHALGEQYRNDSSISMQWKVVDDSYFCEESNINHRPIALLHPHQMAAMIEFFKLNRAYVYLNWDLTIDV